MQSLKHTCDYGEIIYSGYGHDNRGISVSRHISSGGILSSVIFSYRTSIDTGCMARPTQEPQVVFRR